MNTSEQCPADSNPMAWLWEHNKPILDELQMVVKPLAKELDDYVDIDVANDDGVSHETMVTAIQRGFPFGAPYTLLPPRLFSELYADAETPQLPQNESEARELIASYAQRRLEPPLEGMSEGTYTTTPESRLAHILDDLLWLMDRRIRIDPAKWEQYRQVGREQAQEGRYDLDAISVMRSNSIKSLYHYAPLAKLVHEHATSAFEWYMAMPTVALDIDGRSRGLAPVGYLFMPEGAYGPQFNERLLRTTAYLIQNAQQNLGNSARMLGQAHPEIIARHTTRGHEGRSPDATLISTVQEGARSCMEVIALLTADKVPGYDDPDQLVKAIVRQGIIEQFTRAIPMGMIGPLLFTGKYFPNPLLHTRNGKLVLNPATMCEIKQSKRAMAQADMATWMTYWATPEENRKDILPPVATSLICPAALPHGALMYTNRAFMRAYCAIQTKP